MMITTAILNATLALGAIVMVVTPLMWAILTQHRDHPQVAAPDRDTAHSRQAQPRRHTAQPSYKPVIGRA